MIETQGLSDGAVAELKALGLVDATGAPLPPSILHKVVDIDRSPIPRQSVNAERVLNEAFHYAAPSAFSRALTFEFGSVSVLLISGTASVDEQGQTVHASDFTAQCWRTYRNITELLRSGGMTWHYVMWTRCYLRDMARDYARFNEIRSAFYNYMGLHPYPASVGIEAGLCRDDLLVEIEAIALCRNHPLEAD